MEILQKGNPILRELSKPIDTDLYLDELISEMIDTMRKANGVGLAAPQVGHLLRLFIVLDVDALEIKRLSYENCVTIFINPKIIRKSEQTSEFEEGCLSIEGIKGVITRPERVMVEYQDKNLKRYVGEFDGYMSRIIQHENDHLNGVLFTDYLV